MMRLANHWKKRVVSNKSLRFRLTLVLSLTALTIWLISTAVAWFQVRHEVNEVFDAQQVLFAQRLASSNLRNILVDNKSSKYQHTKFKKGGFDDDALGFAIFTQDGNILLSDGHNGDNFIFTSKKGFSISHILGDDDKWRIFWLPVNNGRLVIAVGQELDYRNDLINKMVFSQMWIWFASLPLLLGIIVWVVTRELQSVKRVSEQLEQRSPDDNTLITTAHLPKEILPLVQNLNQFFERTATMLLRERQFTSDAAHELRSPLAALRIQTEVTQMVGDDAALRQEALENLTKGIDRASQLIDQLLTLSRLDSLNELENVENIDWQALITSLIGERYFAAQKRQIDLQFELMSKPDPTQGQPLLLSLMLRNLIDNAIKYCPNGSTVKVILQRENLLVEDNGEGVKETDLAKLGQRFYRPAGQNEKGSGLGLSIVYRIAALHHYQVRLENVKNIQGDITGFRALILFKKV
ncbi:two-component system sensor histidine kinase QseC [Pasteurella canis]|uniref:quorum sensing histidine kinase QseC n=1 Tax=Pasteurella canis TaxID=753 RepID=UPI001D10ACC1|nr:quorum sensing histidine kinase QseC [Pasteurella canis]UDW84091.1 two-component system sensor histidine kinase QseC [Pasteurella canis]